MTNTTNTILVKAGTLPGRVQEVAVVAGSKVSDVLATAGLTVGNYEIKVNGATATTETVVAANSLVLLTKKVKGNAGIVKVGILPGRVQEVAVENGATIKQAIDAAGLTVGQYEVKVDGNTVTDLNTAVGNANIILLTKKVKGNTGIVKVGILPGRVQEVALENNATVQDAISAAGLTVGNYEVKVDGNTVTDLSSKVGNANIILLTKKVKGNAGIVKVGILPGRVQEVAVDNGATIKNAIDAAGLTVGNYEVKVDGNTVTDLSTSIGNANIILLTKKVKGNAGIVKVGILPGRVQEVALDNGATIQDAITAAGLTVGNYEVKVDGNTVTNLSTSIGNANIVLLTKKVKGNAGVVKVGILPGRVQEVALESGATIKDALDAAGLQVGNYEVKVDGSTVTELSTPIGNANIVLLTKKVKGNAGIVKVGILPGRVQEVAVENNASVQDAINAAGLQVGNYEVKVDGNTVTDLSTRIGNAGIILLTKKVKGNAGVVKVGILPGRVQEVALDNGATVQDAINAAGLTVGNYEVKVDGSTITNLSSPIGNAGIILLTKKVKGN